MSIGYEKITIGVEDGDVLRYVKSVTGDSFELGVKAEAQVFSNTEGYETIKNLSKANPDTTFLVYNGETVE